MYIDYIHLNETLKARRLFPSINSEDISLIIVYVVQNHARTNSMWVTVLIYI